MMGHGLKCERGLKVRNRGSNPMGGVLMHSKLMEQGREVARVVVPIAKRSG